MKSVKTEYIKAIDSIRVISIFAVLLIHTTTKILEYKHYDLINYWPTLFLNQIARFAVPLFILISGFVLELTYKQDIEYKIYIKKRLGKIFIPYLFWSLLYYFFVYNNNSSNFLYAIITGNASYQLYFIPAICIFYLIFPILHKFKDLLFKPYSLAFLAVFQIYLMQKDYFIRQFSLVEPLRIFLLSFFFFVSGMAAEKYREKIIIFAEKYKYLLIILWFYLSYYIFNEGRSRYLKIYNIGAFYSQWRPDILMFTLITGVLLFYLFDKRRLQLKILEVCSKYSYFVFFVHVIFLELTWKVAGTNIFNRFVTGNITELIFNLLFFTIVSMLSFGQAILSDRIPNFKKITG